MSKARAFWFGGLVLGLAGCNGRISSGDAQDPGGGSAPATPPGKAPASSTGSPAPTGNQVPLACRGGKPPAPRIWRLSASQYNNTITALIPGAGAPADRFPSLSIHTNVFKEQAGSLSLPTAYVSEAFASTRDLAVLARAAHVRSYPCLGATQPDPTCMKSFLREFGLRAFRRPLDASEIDDYYADFASWQGKRGTVAAAEDLYRALLGSPFFLFRTELGVGGASGGPAARCRSRSARDVASGATMLGALPDGVPPPPHAAASIRAVSPACCRGKCTRALPTTGVARVGAGVWL
jgi:hypothetical protein